MDTIGKGVMIEGWLTLHMEYIFHHAFSDVIALHLLIPLPVNLGLHVLNGSLSSCCHCVPCLCNGQHEQRGKLKLRLVLYQWELMLIELILCCGTHPIHHNLRVLFIQLGCVDRVEGRHN